MDITLESNTDIWSQKPFGRLFEHEKRVSLLSNIAFLAGCNVSINRYLPDGRQPDVMQIDVQKGTLFIGDAKVTEHPSNLSTIRRLRSYMKWVEAHASIPGTTSIFAICFMNAGDTQGWVDTIYGLGQEVGVVPAMGGVTDFLYGYTAVWFVFRKPSSSLAGQGGT